MKGPAVDPGHVFWTLISWRNMKRGTEVSVRCDDVFYLAGLVFWLLNFSLSLF